MFKSIKWAALILSGRRDGARGRNAGALLTGTNFSVSSGVGFLALFGVSVQTGVIMLEYINQLRARGYTIEDAAMEGADTALAAYYDDHAGGHAGATAGGTLAWDRLGFATALRDRDRRRTGRRAAFERILAANVVCLGCSRR